MRDNKEPTATRVDAPTLAKCKHYKRSISQRCIDTGLRCCNNRLHYQPSTDRVFCNACAPDGRHILDLPKDQQQLILEAVRYV